MPSSHFLGEDIDSFWDTLSKLHASSSWPESKRGETGRFVDEPCIFDHRFFNVSPREASSIDPQSRRLLEAIYSSLEEAGFMGRQHTLAPSRDAQHEAYHIVELLYRTTRETSRVFGPSRISWTLLIAGHSNSTSLVLHTRTLTPSHEPEAMDEEEAIMCIDDDKCRQQKCGKDWTL